MRQWRAVSNILGRSLRKGIPLQREPFRLRWLSTTPIPWSNAESDFDAARKWHAQTGQRPLPDDIGEVSYARSSGPGGQSVNK